MQLFFGEETPRWAVFQSSDPTYYAGVGAFIETLSGFGLADSRPTVADGSIFRHQGLRQAIEEFLQRYPGRPLPLRHITVMQKVAAASARADFEKIQAELASHREALHRFATAYNLGIHLHVYVGGFDAGGAAPLCAGLEDGALESLVFIYGFPALTAESAAVWRSELALFLDDPRSRRPGVSLAGFPFCLAPPAHFKALFRYSLNDLRGLIGSQRYTIGKVAGQRHAYLPPCAACRCQAACYAFTDVKQHPGYASVVVPQTEDTIAFIGGSLPRAEAPPDPRLVYTTPVEQGDLLMAILAGFRNILILDGYFYSKFPCTTFEVVLALEQGLNVFGAASIGALRAVELDRYGMTGVGYVYDYLRRQPIKPYHIVAQTYTEDDAALTRPLVEIIYFLECATSDGLLGAGEAEQCRAVADGIGFPLLSFDFFFRRLREAGSLAEPALRRLEDYYAREGAERFAIKQADARQLLACFREILAGRAADYVRKTFRQARVRYMERLYAKYRGDADLTLPAAWREFAAPPDGRGHPRRDRRALPAEETCRRAEEFFRDLDVVVADTTGYDPPGGSFIVNIFFVPFYFLGYPLSSSTGNGEVFAEALAAAYMELVERIPTHNFRRAAFKGNQVDRIPEPLENIPQYYNFAVDPQIKQQVAEDHGFVTVTELPSGQPCSVPRFAVMSMFSGTDGNAAGNTLPEALLYGLYELVERDTNQLYSVDPFCREQLPRLRLDPATLPDPRSRELIGRLEEKGCRIALYILPNLFGLPCVRCRLFDAHRGIEGHGSTAVRADLPSAVAATLHEVYMQHIAYFTGIRDDYRSFQPLREARLAYQAAQVASGETPLACQTLRTEELRFASITDELEHVIGCLLSAGHRRMLVANTSPLERYGVSSVKVIIPGLELWFVPEYQPSGFIAARAQCTRALLADFLKGG
ncbi:MAG: YcaO-like family protein [Kiritimatiellaeota bacterium]|nr:YcaO-like family protein [Kiritimatiellota bacterium]